MSLPDMTQVHLNKNGEKQTQKQTNETDHDCSISALALVALIHNKTPIPSVTYAALMLIVNCRQHGEHRAAGSFNGDCTHHPVTV